MIVNYFEAITCGLHNMDIGNRLASDGKYELAKEKFTRAADWYTFASKEAENHKEFKQADRMRKNAENMADSI